MVSRLTSCLANRTECIAQLALAFAEIFIRCRGSPSDDRPWNDAPDSVDVVRISEGRDRSIHRHESAFSRRWSRAGLILAPSLVCPDYHLRGNRRHPRSMAPYHWAATPAGMFA